jgi:hypothetical protein
LQDGDDRDDPRDREHDRLDRRRPLDGRVRVLQVVDREHGDRAERARKPIPEAVAADELTSQPTMTIAAPNETLRSFLLNLAQISPTRQASFALNRPAAWARPA